MAIHFKCKCGNKMEAPEDFVGKEARCGVCGKYAIVPAKSEFVPDPATAVRAKLTFSDDHIRERTEYQGARGKAGIAGLGLLIGGAVTAIFGVLAIAGHRELMPGALIGVGIMALSVGMVIGEWTLLAADVADRLREVNNNTR